MNHQKIYESIIENAIQENRVKGNGTYYENHHILPKCLKGRNNKENLVLLTGKEHYICHKLLTYIYPDNRGITLAFLRMIHSKNCDLPISSRDYEYAKNKLSEQMKGRKLSKEHKKKISENNAKVWKGKKFSKKHKLNLSKSKKEYFINNDNLLLGRKRPGFGEKQKGGKNPMYGSNFYKKWKEKFGKEEADKKYLKWKKNQIGKKNGFDNVKNQNIECEYCGIITNIGNYKRWHGNKCKLLHIIDI